MDTELLKFKFNINLQRLSMIKAAINLWSNTEIRKKIDEHFGDRKNVDSKNWHRIAQQVITNLHSLKLPKRMQREFEDIVLFIGEKIRNWMNWLVTRLGLDISFTKKIYWTDQGTIDESKIFQLYWEKDANIRNMKKTDKLPSPPLYYLAAIFAQKDFINEHKKEITEETNRLLSPFKIVENEYTFFIMYIWSVLCMDRTVKYFSKRFSVMSAVKCLPKYSRSMFDMVRPIVVSAYCGYSKFINCFWHAMARDGTPTSCLALTGFVRVFMTEFSYYQSNSTFNYERDKMFETVLFLAPYHGDDFNGLLRRNGAIFLKHVLLTWPYQECFLELFRCVLLNKKEFEELMFFIKCRGKLKEIVDDTDFSRKNVYNVLLKCIEHPSDLESLMKQFLSS